MSEATFLSTVPQPLPYLQIVFAKLFAPALLGSVLPHTHLTERLRNFGVHLNRFKIGRQYTQHPVIITQLKYFIQVEHQLHKLYFLINDKSSKHQNGPA